MPEANGWVFEQLGGDKRTITLLGHNAPFGRPRKSPVVADELRIRHKATYYGGNRAPSRLIFGWKHEPWTLHGRWMDAQLGGPGTAMSMARKMRQFVADEQQVAIRWGDILAFRGLIARIKTGREGPGDVAWELEVEIDQDEDLDRPREGPTPMNIAQVAKAVDRELAAWLAVAPTAPKGRDLFGTLGAIKEDFLDTVDSLVSAVNTPSAMLLKVSEEGSSLASATTSSLSRLKGGVTQLQTAILNLEDAFGTRSQDDILYLRSAESDVTWQSQRAAGDAQSTEILAMLADMDRQIEIAQRGQSNSSIVGEANDSWEALATRAGGSPDDADKVRAANGARYGELPVAGRQYVIPAL